MVHRSTLCLIGLPLLSLACAAQTLNIRGFGGTGSISGKVVQGGGGPARGVLVEVNELGTLIPVAQTYTSSNGDFDFHAIPTGRYEVIVTSGIDRVREPVDITMAGTIVTIRLPEADVSDRGGRNSVSVNQLKAPKKARAAFKRAEDAIHKGEFELAWQQVGTALQIYPNYSEALTLRGILQLQANKLEEARTDLEEAVRCDPGYALSHLVLGAAYNRLARFDDALRVLDRGIALAPAAWQGYFESGKALLGKSDFKGALQRLQKAETLVAQAYAPIQLAKAQAWLGMKNYPDAMSGLQAYLDRNPKDPLSAEVRKMLESVRAFAPR